MMAREKCPNGHAVWKDHPFCYICDHYGSKRHRRKVDRKCDQCSQIRACVSQLERALTEAPAAYKVTIQLVIDALIKEIRDCLPFNEWGVK